METAASGREAVAKAEALRPDVILMDIAMPGMNGIEATRVICQAEPSIRVIILSMYHTGEHVFRAREVLQFVVEGKTSAAIAKILSLSPKSVETYRSRLMKKLGVTNVPSLVKFAMQHGFTSLE